MFTHDTQIIKDKGAIQWDPKSDFDFQIMFTILQLEKVDHYNFYLNGLFNEMLNVIMFEVLQNIKLPIFFYL